MFEHPCLSSIALNINLNNELYKPEIFLGQSFCNHAFYKELSIEKFQKLKEEVRILICNYFPSEITKTLQETDTETLVTLAYSSVSFTSGKNCHLLKIICLFILSTFVTDDFIERAAYKDARSHIKILIRTLEDKTKDVILPEQKSLLEFKNIIKGYNLLPQFLRATKTLFYTALLSRKRQSNFLISSISYSDYESYRLITAGLEPLLVLGATLIDVDVNSFKRVYPEFNKLVSCVIKSVFLINDIVSLNKELHQSTSIKMYSQMRFSTRVKSLQSSILPFLPLNYVLIVSFCEDISIRDSIELLLCKHNQILAESELKFNNIISRVENANEQEFVLFTYQWIRANLIWSNIARRYKSSF